MPATIISAMGGPISPSTAASEPSTPAQRHPYITAKFKILPPGSTWHSASCSLNSSGVSQRRSWTMTRRDQASTPPKPQTAILAKARNSSDAPGTCPGECDAALEAGDGSGSVMVQSDQARSDGGRAGTDAGFPIPGGTPVV